MPAEGRDGANERLGVAKVGEAVRPRGCPALDRPRDVHGGRAQDLTMTISPQMRRGEEGVDVRYLF